jgi:hypothetical protein
MVAHRQARVGPTPTVRQVCLLDEAPVRFQNQPRRFIDDPICHLHDTCT